MGGGMDDEQDRSISYGEGSPLSLGSVAGIDLDPKAHKLLYEGKKELGVDARELILARITPRELVFIEYVYRHPEQTDEEVMTALGLRESTVLAYYAHLGRNFNVRNSSELRHWVFKNQLVRMPDDEPEEDKVDKPNEGFDPWVRWY